ncbi:MAG: hypothetical protein CL885_03920 [Dehalococcoidia bacterium]|nr:hypothetical protein [Dehalococcoidia bacterium]
MSLIGICGVARSGKDTLFLSLENSEPSFKWKRLAFADELKMECEEFLLKHTGISPFTQVNEEKELIRPFLVAYGTHLRRKINPDCWIDVVKPKLKKNKAEGLIPVLTDVRFPNELNWIREEGGKVIHISRTGVNPANKEEAENDPILRSMADIRVSWPTFKGDYLRQCKKIAKDTIKELKISS